MSDVTRIPKAHVSGIYGNLAKFFSRRILGQEAAPLAAMWHSPKVVKGLYGLGRKADKWKHLDPDLKAYSHMVVASTVGCTWCLDLGYFQAQHEGLDLVKASEVPRWRESEVFSPLERDVMEYAEAVTQTPPAVTDEMFANLLRQVGEPAMVELTAWIGLNNVWTRINTSFSIESQGFSAACELPLAEPSTQNGSATALRS